MQIDLSLCEVGYLLDAMIPYMRMERRQINKIRRSGKMTDRETMCLERCYTERKTLCDKLGMREKEME